MKTMPTTTLKIRNNKERTKTMNTRRYPLLTTLLLFSALSAYGLAACEEEVDCHAVTEECYDYLDDLWFDCEDWWWDENTPLTESYCNDAFHYINGICWATGHTCRTGEYNGWKAEYDFITAGNNPPW